MPVASRPGWPSLPVSAVSAPPSSLIARPYIARTRRPARRPSGRDLPDPGEDHGGGADLVRCAEGLVIADRDRDGRRPDQAPREAAGAELHQAEWREHSVAVGVALPLR